VVLAVVCSWGWAWGARGAQPVESKWEKEIAGLEARLQAKPPGPGSVVLFGSSSFRLWPDAETAFPGHRVVNLGFGGCEFRDLADYFERLVVPLAPKVILLYGGDNDLASGKSPERVEADLRRLAEQIRTALPGARVGILAVKPSQSRRHLLGVQQETNARLRQFARGHRNSDNLDIATPLLDRQGEPEPALFKGDRLHLNAAGYARWRSVIGPYLERADR